MTKKVRFGVRLPVSGPLASRENIFGIGIAADELGFDALTTHDHISMSYEGRYHNAGGSAEMVDKLDSRGESVTNLFESMVTLSILAGKTTEVRLIPCSLVLPWRHPVLLAKQAISLHELSKGRFVLSVVIGNIESDFQAMNVDFKKRGKLMDEYLRVLRILVSSNGGENFQGEFISVTADMLSPRPTSKIPIWIGGSLSEKVFDRVASYGDGLITMADPEKYHREIPTLRKVLRSAGRDDEIELGTQTFMCLMKNREEAMARSRYTVERFFHGPEWRRSNSDNNDEWNRAVEDRIGNALIGSPDDVIEKIQKYTNAGISFFDIRQVNQSLDDVLEMMKLFATEVMPSFN
jgi:alkanesulfonate monooxygenase SsuD/methylene tetrahydromethanopterin reductase-like flavin-dependent oxidoreductase (luciferase family)